MIQEEIWFNKKAAKEHFFKESPGDFDIASFDKMWGQIKKITDNIYDGSDGKIKEGTANYSGQKIKFKYTGFNDSILELSFSNENNDFLKFRMKQLKQEIEERPKKKHSKKPLSEESANKVIYFMDMKEKYGLSLDDPIFSAMTNEIINNSDKGKPVRYNGKLVKIITNGNIIGVAPFSVNTIIEEYNRRKAKEKGNEKGAMKKPFLNI